MYLILQLCGIDYCTSLTFDVDVNFGFWLSSDVVQTALIRIVWPVGSCFLLLEPFKLIVNVVLVPCIIVILNCIYIPKQVFLNLFALLLCFIFLLFWLFLLFLNLFLQLLWYLHFLCSLLLQHSYLCLLF